MEDLTMSEASAGSTATIAVVIGSMLSSPVAPIMPVILLAAWFWFPCGPSLTINFDYYGREILILQSAQGHVRSCSSFRLLQSEIRTSTGITGRTAYSAS